MSRYVEIFFERWLCISNAETLCSNIHQTKRVEEQSILEFTVDINISEILEELRLYLYCYIQQYVDIKIIGLLNLPAKFGNLLLNSPETVELEFKELLHGRLVRLGWISSLNNISQLAVHFKIYDLPPLPGLQILNPRQIERCNTKKLYRIDGVIISKSFIATFIRSSCYVCNNCNCPGSVSSNCTIIHHCGFFKQPTSRTALCNFCGEFLIEDPAGRILADMCIIEMVPCAALTLNTFHCYQTLTVYLRGEHAYQVEIGGSYTVTVFSIPSTTYKTARMTLEACSVTELKEHNLISIDKALYIKMKGFCQICKDKNLGTQALPFILAFTFADCQTVRGSYYKLKLGILLSLVNCEEERHNGIDILAIGEDTVVLNRLFQYGANLSPRATRIVSSKQLKSTLSKHRQGHGIFVLEGNPLLLSNRGICNFGDLNKFSKATQDTIAKILESRIIPIDYSRLPEGLYTKAVKMENYYKGSSWAYINCSSKCSRYLFDEFSIAYHCDDENWETRTPEIQSRPYFNVDEIKKIIAHAKGIKAHLGPKVESIIQQYFVASRRVRSSTNTGVEFPISSLLTIARLTSSIAKLSLRTEVLEEDATLAIFMYEEYMTSRYGPSQLRVQTQSHIPMCSTLDVIQKMMEDLAFFKKNLNNFLKSFAGDTCSLQPEE